MDKNKFIEMLAVPTLSRHEEQLVFWLLDYLRAHVPTAKVTVDEFLNIYVVKGDAPRTACVAAHIDSVQPIRPVTIVEAGDRLSGVNPATGRPCGFGADDKAGVYVCLNLLERFDNLRAVFFACEEIGCLGARAADPAFFEGVSCVIEYDCPSRNMLSHTVSGVRLFENDGDFINAALPVLEAHGTTLWQDHPYTDVMAIRLRFPIPCLNLSCGYYNWHATNEFISLSDTKLAFDQGVELLCNLTNLDLNWCPVDLSEDKAPSLMPVGRLFVPEAICQKPN